MRALVFTIIVTFIGLLLVLKSRENFNKEVSKITSPKYIQYNDTEYPLEGSILVVRKDKQGHLFIEPAQEAQINSYLYDTN